MELEDIDFEKEEEANISSKNQSSTVIYKYIIFSFIFFLIFALLIFIFIRTRAPSQAANFNHDINLTHKFNIIVNLTSEEYEELKQKVLIVDRFLNSRSDSNFFTPLFKQESSDYNQKSHNHVPLNKISFMISSSPKTAYLCKLYLDIWSTRFGSNIIKSTGARPLSQVYWSFSDVTKYTKYNVSSLTSTEFLKSKSYNVSLINQTSHHKKWFYMIKENFKTVPSDIEWFIILDDDTLPFIDRITESLSNYENPMNNSYFFHSPGERTSGIHLGNGGSGFIISRKLATTIMPELDDCNKYIRRRFYNGDIRLDHCIRYKTGTMPILDYGMYQLDSKALSGNMTGFIENYADKYIMKSFHHLEKSIFYLFPKEFISMMHNNDLNNVHYSQKVSRKMIENVSLDFDTFSDPNHFSQAAHFAHSLAVSGDLFLKRFIIMLTNDDRHLCGILNFGYSFVVFSSNFSNKGDNNLLKDEIYYYLQGVESTFESTPGILYENLSRLIIPQNEKLKRFYLKKIVSDENGKNSYFQEFCSISSPKTVVKIHVDDNQKVSLSFFDFSSV